MNRRNFFGWILGLFGHEESTPTNPYFHGKKCEVCGKQAMAEVADGIEGDPVVGNDGMSYSWFHSIRPTHFYCAKHKRKPIDYRRVRTDPSRMVREDRAWEYYPVEID